MKVIVRFTVEVPMSGTMDEIIEKLDEKFDKLKPVGEMEVYLGEKLLGTFDEDGWTQCEEIDE